jgi:hypothetical protein
MPAIRCWRPSAACALGLGGLSQTDIGVPLSVAMLLGVARRLVMWSGGAPVRQLVSRARVVGAAPADGPAPIRLVAEGWRAFVQRARGWVSIPICEAGLSVWTIGRIVDRTLCAPFGRRAGASVGVCGWGPATGARSQMHISRLGCLPACRETLAGTAFTDLKSEI